ncbi:MAG: DUF4976 domain-containing protein, partial [Deltaproteobacteria bacterium]|nr:DUF4976 domain-containing protein [Deltaproteobacteria bacterium]
CEMVGLPVPQTVQYKSLKPTLQNPQARHRDHLYFAYMKWQRAVRDQRYKLIEYCVENERHSQLFDLEKDPNELTNLAGDPKYSAQLQALRKRLQAERVLLNDGNTPYPFTNEQGTYFWSRYEASMKAAGQ